MSGKNKLIDSRQRGIILSFLETANHVRCQRAKASYGIEINNIGDIDLFSLLKCGRKNAA